MKTFNDIICSQSYVIAHKGATRRGAKRAEAPPLAKSQLRKKIKYWVLLIFFMSRWSEVTRFGQFIVWKIDCDTVKLRKVTYDVIFMML